MDMSLFVHLPLIVLTIHRFPSTLKQGVSVCARVCVGSSSNIDSAYNIIPHRNSFLQGQPRNIRLFIDICDYFVHGLACFLKDTNFSEPDLIT